MPTDNARLGLSARFRIRAKIAETARCPQTLKSFYQTINIVFNGLCSGNITSIMINIFRQGLCHFHLWAFSLRHHQMALIEAGHGLPVAIDEIEVSFGSKDAPVLDRAEPGDPSEANKDRNQRLSSSAFANPYFRALRTPF